MPNGKTCFLSEFASDMAYADMAENLAKQFCILYGFDEEDAADYSVSVRELTINAIRHGNKNKRERRVKLEFYQNDGEIKTFVQDEGEERFDPQNYFTANGENALSDHGRGLMFVSLYTPDWTYEWMDPGNRFGVHKMLTIKDAECLKV